MTFLVDTNVLSERRKRTPDPNFLIWHARIPTESLFTSVLVVGELRRWIEGRRRRDTVAADSLDVWLRQAESELGDRILPVTRDVAVHWGRLGVPDPVSPIDGLIAATALVHDLTVVTRNTSDFEPTGVRTLNPFEAPNGK